VCTDPRGQRNPGLCSFLLTIRKRRRIFPACKRARIA